MKKKNRALYLDFSKGADLGIYLYGRGHGTCL